MALIVWQDAAPVDNVTTLTAARWEQLKTDITAQVNGALDDANLGTITVTSLGQPNAYYTKTINCLHRTGTIISDTAAVGVLTNVTVDFRFRMHVASTLLAVETSNVASQGAADARVRNITAGSDVSGTTTAFTTASSVLTTGLTVSLAAGIVYAGRVTVPAGGGNGVQGGQIILHLKAVHQG
jgi:hypothetical protein